MPPGLGIDSVKRRHSCHHVVGNMAMKTPCSRIIRLHIGNQHIRRQELKHIGMLTVKGHQVAMRSEERRVGKECRL